MFLKRRIMKALIALDKESMNSYTPAYNFDFCNKHNQKKVLAVCETLVTEEKLAEWESEPHYPNLMIRVTELGKEYFSLKRNRLVDRAVGFVFGVATTVVASYIIRLI